MITLILTKQPGARFPWRLTRKSRGNETFIAQTHSRDDALRKLRDQIDELEQGDIEYHVVAPDDCRDSY